MDRVAKALSQAESYQVDDASAEPELARGRRLAAQTVDSIKAALEYEGKDRDKMRFYLKTALSSARDTLAWVEGR